MVDSVNVGGGPKPGADQSQADHDAAMAAKAEEGGVQITSKDSQTGEELHVTPGTPEGGDSKPERPADIPEKFWDAEKGEVNVQALLKSQKDAEAALRQQQSGKPDDKSGEPSTEDKSGDDDGTPKGDTPAQQSAIDTASAEFAEKGELSDETYESLAKSGLPRELVDNYIAGQQAMTTSLQNAAFGEFGGTQESYSKATAWAAENLSQDEIDALDVQLTSTNPAIVREGAKALAARYNAEADITPGRTVSGGGNDTSTGSYFQSSHEMTAAMADPRYAKDAAFRAEVEAKVKRSSDKGINLWG